MLRRVAKPQTAQQQDGLNQEEFRAVIDLRQKLMQLGILTAGTEEEWTLYCERHVLSTVYPDLLRLLAEQEKQSRPPREHDGHHHEDAADKLDAEHDWKAALREVGGEGDDDAQDGEKVDPPKDEAHPQSSPKKKAMFS